MRREIELRPVFTVVQFGAKRSAEWYLDIIKVKAHLPKLSSSTRVTCLLGFSSNGA